MNRFKIFVINSERKPLQTRIWSDCIKHIIQGKWLGSSALEVNFNVTRSTNSRFTYLYLHTGITKTDVDYVGVLQT